MTSKLKIYTYALSFISDIFIAPLQVRYYSEAFLTAALILCRS